MEHINLIGKKILCLLVSLFFLTCFGFSASANDEANKEEIDLTGPESALKDAMDKLFSLIEPIEKEKKLSPNEKTEKILNTIKNSRWGPEQDNYFWIIDINGDTIGEPICMDMEGTSVIHYSIIDYQENPEAKKAFSELIKACNKKGEAFFQYISPECRRDPADLKIAFARLFGYKKWIVITGIYRDTIEAYQAPVETNFFTPADDGPGPIDDSEPASGI